MKQLHKKFSDEQVKEILSKYESGAVQREYICEILGIRRSRFFDLIKKYRSNDSFSIAYARTRSNHRLEEEHEPLILETLKQQKALIDDIDIPIRKYNYSYAAKTLQREYDIEVSVPAIIDRAKQWGYYKSRQKSKKTHDRLVITNNTGELIQHDSSHHLFAPLSQKKWYLITSIDDHSRLLVEARFVDTESSMEHIKSLERVFTHHGLPFSYYTDSHSIFRYVAGRDDMLPIHKNAYIPTDGIDTQWLQVLTELGVQKRNALSPQAKGKIERPYQWIQDHVVRRCMSDKIIKLSEGQQVLDEEVRFYNYKRIHSTTGEVPFYRFQRALKEGRSLWRNFEIPKPLLSLKDIFALRLQRRADGYRTIHLKNMQFKINNVNPYDDVDIRIYKLNNTISELRFWRHNQFLDIQIVKNSFLKAFHL